jgi:hypothetical protein
MNAQRRFAYDRWGNRTGEWDATSGGNQLQDIVLQQSGGIPTNRIQTVSGPGGNLNFTYGAAVKADWGKRNEACHAPARAARGALSDHPAPTQDLQSAAARGLALQSIRGWPSDSRDAACENLTFGQTQLEGELMRRYLVTIRRAERCSTVSARVYIAG